MTYPLISERGQLPNVNDPKARPYGMPSYLEQVDKVLALATEEPKQWEVEFNVLTYLLFSVVNPLTMSSKVRNKFASVKKERTQNPYVELFIRRLEGTDETSNALVAQIISLVNR